MPRHTTGKYLLIINPGSTSTKVGLSIGPEIVSTSTLHHDPEELQKFNTIIEQSQMRLNAIEGFLNEQKLSYEDLQGIVARGGFLDPIESGTYIINDKMLGHLRTAKNGQHASNLGAILAHELASKAGHKAFVVDPPSVDELDESARYSGIPDLPRHSQLHALNIRRVALRIAKENNKNLRDCNFVVTHIGGGVSVCAMRKGKMVDVNNANHGGPFSPERSAGLPAGDLLRLCFTGEYSELELRRKIQGQGGLVAYLGTNDGREIEKRIEQGDQEAKKVYLALAYQVIKEIGAMATILKSIDGLIFTGGLSYSKYLINYITSHVDYLGPVFIVPGENELLALAEGASRVLEGLEQSKIY